MLKVLLIGNSPLPDENVKIRPAAGLRTYQFLKTLKESENVSDTKALLINMSEEEEKKQVSEEGYLRFSKNNPLLKKSLQNLYQDFQPDVVVSVNTYPSFITSKYLNFSKHNVAFWADLNGWIMAEAQAQAFKMNSNAYLPHYYKMEKSVVRKADKFSTVSNAQKNALYGELAFCGRLNKQNFGYEFVENIPNGIEWFKGEEEEKDAPFSESPLSSSTGSEDDKSGGNDSSPLSSSTGTPHLMRELPIGNSESSVHSSEKASSEKNNNFSIGNLPSNAFFALWLGGYNTWVDEETLFNGLEKAMEQCENLYFLSTGGTLQGLDNKTFANFQKMVNESKFKHRFIFLGWIDTKDIPLIYRKAHIGLNVDRVCAETTFGARNRINEMMKFGLPVISTLGSEISYEMMLTKAGIGVKSGDNEELANALIELYNSDNLEEYSENGENYIQEKCNYKFVMSPFLKWLKNPKSSPDKNIKINLTGGKLQAGFKYLKENGIRKFFKKAFRRG